MIVGLIGVLKAGGAYVGLEPNHPQERLAYMLEDSQAKVILTQQRFADKLSMEGVITICLDTDWDVIAHESDENLLSHATADNLAYVIYTSGSTGQPKGVAVEHRQITSYVNGVLERLKLQPGASFATVSTFAADLGNTAIFPALCSGGCLHVISQERIFNPDALADYFSRHSIDCLKIVPSHLAALQNTARPEQVMPRQVLVLGGEATHSDMVENLRAFAPECRIMNHYGPTETTVGVLTFEVEEGRFASKSSTLLLGRPIANRRIYLLDSQFQPVPVGVAGELYIGGDGLARGYLNQASLTAESFVPDPFGAEPGARLYRTGDLARYLPDGNIEFLGRFDDQVKIRGFRIELEEIEAVLREHENVKDISVQVKNIADRPEDNQLVAYVVPTEECAPRVCGHMRYKLPNNMAIAHLNKNETDYIYREIFELQAYLKHGIEINEGDCVFDVGANIGLFTLFANQLCRNVRVYAFEPNPSVFDLLKANVSLYGRNARLFDCGLSSQSRTSGFTFFRGFSLLSGLYADTDAEKQVIKAFMLNQQRLGANDVGEIINQADDILADRLATETFDIRLRTLSSVIEEEGIKSIDLLKINVEKSELDVLLGIKQDDWKKIKQIVLEVDVKENLDTIVSLLERHGYDFTVEQDVLLESTQLCYIYALRPSEDRSLLTDQGERAHLRNLPTLSEPFLSSGELRMFLSRKLPDYMLPSAFVMIDSLPLTPNGKLDRKALPDPESFRSGLESAYVAPSSEMERVIVSIWQQVLRVDKVGLYDNFFDLGGHSLLLVQVYSRLRQTLERDLSIVDMFKYTTVSALAKYLSQQVNEQLPIERGQHRAESRRDAMKHLTQFGRKQKA